MGIVFLGLGPGYSSGSGPGYFSGYFPGYSSSYFPNPPHFTFFHGKNLSHTVERLLSSPLTLVPRMSASGPNLDGSDEHQSSGHVNGFLSLLNYTFYSVSPFARRSKIASLIPKTRRFYQQFESHQPFISLASSAAEIVQSLFNLSSSNSNLSLIVIVS
jgi:hypothetical protein|uniref:Uncharacterized protein n=1 Tax=Picea glauca TaxID=3330 RepID=A0A101M411_PICGL|nr:hypothetical protein ABT39_MTgene407 [Picea glauca]QHR92182.1 hypothetical protein Q903MT_gene6219 [Picea sitchensis]